MMEEKWILVSDHLPDEYEKIPGHGLHNVLITHTRGVNGGMLCVDQAIFYKGQFHIQGERNYCKNVIAWMELPKPYNPESEEV